MGFLDLKDHPDGCTCCWIMGYGVDEQNPSEWAEKMFSLDEECPYHGSEVRGAGEVGASGRV
jgi:hypothetical protein